jgi:hypothetical protein
MMAALAFVCAIASCASGRSDESRTDNAVPSPDKSGSASSSSGGGEISATKPLWELTGPEMDHLVARWQEERDDMPTRVRAILLSRLGTPYVLGCLGEGAGADPDSDPVFRLDQVDCTVLVLTTAALAHARTLDEARQNMALANYREIGDDRPITYEARLHFTEDRLDASPYFENITRDVVPAELLESKTLTLNVREDGSGLLPIEWTRKITLDYLPVAGATEAVLAALPPVTGVAFIKHSYAKMGLAAAHEGVVLDGEDLVHASSESKKVVRVPLREYLRKADGSPRFDGLVFYAFR